MEFPVEAIIIIAVFSASLGGLVGFAFGMSSSITNAITRADEEADLN